MSQAPDRTYTSIGHFFRLARPRTGKYPKKLKKYPPCNIIFVFLKKSLTVYAFLTKKWVYDKHYYLNLTQMTCNLKIITSVAHFPLSTANYQNFVVFNQYHIVPYRSYLSALIEIFCIKKDLLSRLARST